MAFLLWKESGEKLIKAKENELAAKDNELAEAKRRVEEEESNLR